MGNLNNSENNLLCCCRNDRSGIPQDFVDINAYEKESIELAKKTVLFSNSNLDLKLRNKTIGENLEMNYMNLPSQKHQVTNSIGSIFSSTEFSLNEESCSIRSSRIEELIYKNKVIIIQRMYRKSKIEKLIRSKSPSSTSQFFSDSRPSINNHSLFLKHIIENSKQPDLYQQDKEKKTHSHSRTVSTNAANSYLHSNFALSQSSERRNLQSSNDLSGRKFGGKALHNTCKLYKQKLNTDSILRLKHWLRSNANINISEECTFGVKLYNNGSKIVGFFNSSNNVVGVGYYDSLGLTSYKGKIL